jgi:hypothetical protein
MALALASNGFDPAGAVALVDALEDGLEEFVEDLSETARRRDAIGMIRSAIASRVSRAEKADFQSWVTRQERAAKPRQRSARGLFDRIKGAPEEKGGLFRRLRR